MKKNLHFLVIIFVLTVGFLFTACSSDSNEPPQKRIRITGIPPEYNGRVGFSGLADGDSTVAYSMPVIISDGSITNYLLQPSTTRPFTQSGNYMVVLVITSHDIQTIYWQGAIFTRSITQETTTISFNDFISLPVSTQLRNRLPKEHISETIRSVREF